MNNCIICKVATPPVLREDSSRSTADEAILFESRGGNYGSTVVDNSGIRIRIAICDHCLLENREAVTEERFGIIENEFGRYEAVVERGPWDPNRRD